MPAKKGKKKIVLLDSHAILHRAYHALPDFASSKGEPTGAIYGLSLMVISIIKQFKPDYIVAAFDLPKPTYRHEVYEDYKAGRKETDSDLVDQIKRSYDFYKAFNIPVFQKEGYEADDVLGTLAKDLKKDFDVIIASGDMDTLQLVDKKKVQVFTLKKGIKDTIIYDEDAVYDRFGFGPKLLPDYKGLRGDSSDNIIGIPGIGEKTATTLITEFGSVKDIYKALEKKPDKFTEKGIKERIQKLLIEHKEEAEFSRMLATIQTDIPIEFKEPEKSWREGVVFDDIQKFFRDLEFRTLIDRVKDILPDQNLFENIEEDNDGSGVNENVAQSKETEKIDDSELEEIGVALWLLNSAITKPTLEDILNYTGEKTFKIAKEKIMLEIDAKNMRDLFEKIEKPLIPIIHEMEQEGVKIDLKFLADLSTEYHSYLDKLKTEIYKMSGQEFNINSPSQLAEVLFEKMELKYKGMRKTSTGKFSTKESVLQKLRPEHEIIDKILEYRELQKLVSTYIDNIPKQISKDGRLHANFLQTGTTTGRMSSNNPNLQNIPIGSERGRKIRKAFVADKGKVLLALDYSQMELRIAAFLSGDEKLIKVFKEGQDIHTAVATEVFKVDPEKVDKEMRRQAKVINFGILYGMGVTALKDNLKSDRKTAQEFYNKYFESFPGLADYLEKTKKDAAKMGYTETMFGRRRYFDGFNSKLPFIRAQAERMAINAPIQGAEADIIKLAVVKVDQYLKKEGLKDSVKLILQIHDEIIYEVGKDKSEKIASKIKDIMEKAVSLQDTKNIPMSVEYEIGPDWGSLK
jgi:DNA polymerase-1